MKALSTTDLEILLDDLLSYDGHCLQSKISKICCKGCPIFNSDDEDPAACVYPAYSDIVKAAEKKKAEFQTLRKLAWLKKL